ncbi:MAG: hypothetical protein K2K92_05375, partial [Duncaniella sp.]|nr:hypothetical protein [Duncaniella sp.]
VYLSVGGRSLSSECREIERRLPSDTIITEDIIKDISAEALRMPLHERTIVDVEKREIRVDNRVTTRPVGEMGSNIQARLNIVSCNTRLVRNHTVVMEESLGLRVVDRFVRPLALADLVLSNEEKKLGCMLVDCGADTTSVAIFKQGVLQHLAVLPMGSYNITLDITALNYLEEQAEVLKRTGGSAYPTHEPAAPGQPDFVAINNYVAARANEIILNIIEQVKYAHLTPEQLPEGIIVVGGGAKLNGFTKRLQEMSGMKVRTGLPGNKVRILDSRIQVADAVDVVSILYQAVKNKPVVCATNLPSAQPVYQQEPLRPGYYEQPAAAQQPTGQPYQHPYQPNNGYQQQPYSQQQPQQPAYAPQQPIAQQPAPQAAPQPVQQHPYQPVQQPIAQQPYGQGPQQPQQPAYTPQQPVASQPQVQQPVQQPVGQPVQQPVQTPLTQGGVPKPQRPIGPDIKPQPPVGPDPEPAPEGGRKGFFGRVYASLVDKVAGVISDGFEEEDDED